MSVPFLFIRPIFSRAQLRYLECDQPLLAHDAETGLTLSYRFNDLGGQLALVGEPLTAPLVIGVDEHDLNLVATLVLNALKHQ